MTTEPAHTRRHSNARPRIASLLSSATEILFELGLGEQVIAVSHECDWPPPVATLPRVTSSYLDGNADSLAIDAEVKQRMADGKSLYDIDREKIASLAPDVIVTQSQCDVCAIRYEDVVNMVETNPELTQTQVISLSPESLDDVLHDIRRIGGAVDAIQAAEEFVGRLTTRLDAVESAVGDLERSARPRVVIIEWLDPIMIAGNWTPGLVRRAGGRYDLATEGRHSPYVEWPKIVAYDPEVLVLAPCGFDIARTVSECQPLTKQTGWQQLSAVRNKRVFVMDGNAYLNRSGPRLVDTVEILAHMIHPDRCPAPEPLANAPPAWQPLAST